MKAIKPRLRQLLFLILLILSAGVSIPASSKGWEPLRVARSDARRVHADAELEIKAARGMLVVTANHVVQIKIFTILGSQIASDSLQPGTYQFIVPAHGVYIVKAGDITCKVAL